jgi:hypothetical protein
MLRTLSGENTKSTISVDKTNETLLEQVSIKLNQEDEVTLIHDPSDIRKPHSKEAEDIGKVRDLKGNIINGYSTHNIIALPSNAKKVMLLSNKTYSNKSDNFLSQDIIKKLLSGKDFDGQDKANKLYQSGKYFNKKTLSKDEITRCSTKLKEFNLSLKITHVLDREFDDNDYISLISKDLNDDFVIRSKKSRTLDLKGDVGKKIRLINYEFNDKGQIAFQKIRFKKRVVQDGKFMISWTAYNEIVAVKITVLDRDGNNVFNDSMLLLTNKVVNNIDDAYAIYNKYLQRSKIEYVFKFLKEGLGWEETQIQNFKAIENLISLCFYVAAYLYEIGEESAYDDYAVMLSNIADGKGKVTRQFILKGIQVVSNYYKYEAYLKNKNVSVKDQKIVQDVFMME